MIRMTATQVPQYWEVIKSTVSMSSKFSGQDLKEWFNTLLFELLNNLAQCYVRIDDERIIKALYITSIVKDRDYPVKCLRVDIIASWGASSYSDWQKDVETLKADAENNECKFIIIDTDVSGLSDLKIFNIFKLFSSSYIYKV